MNEKTFLVEIGTEELPPKVLRSLAEAFATRLSVGLNNAGLAYRKVNWFATPRRLALKVAHLATMQLDREIENRGPPISKAFDSNGIATKEAHAWACRNGITLNQAKCFNNKKGEYLAYHTFIKGQQAQSLLPGIVATALSKLPIPKLMRWGTSDIQFVRPIHTVTLLLNDALIPATILGVQSNRVIYGHRFMGKQKLILEHADQYPQILLERGKVIADYNLRKSEIKKTAEIIAYQLNGNVDLSDNLLEEVTSLVEWPVVLRAKFEEKFLSVPTEALVYTMKVDQKYFPIYSHDGHLLPYFIFVANIESKDVKQVIKGNEKVVRARFSDAKFFFNTDRKQSLEDNLKNLKNILFQKELGTLREKTSRIIALAKWIAIKIGANVNHAARAALLSKCDLVTNMVCEFTDMQGIIGMHYARCDGEVEDVAVAINEHYQPRFSGDNVPANLVSCAVAIADKIDTLAGIFGVNQPPKGDKDPFALRRSALGVLRIIVEKRLPLDLQTLTEEAVRLYGAKINNVNIVNKIIDFILGRFYTWYQQKGYEITIIQAVMVCRPTRPADFDARVKAISQLYFLKEWNLLVIANKRISNILAKSKLSDRLNDNIQIALLKENAEIQLANFITVLNEKLQPHFEKGCYMEALIELAKLVDPINNFFNNVMVNTDDSNIRINRLTLLAKIRDLFLQIADISIL
ncbi:glycyl-tRNA synthetase subunit beta [Candidatus Pantoea carbekii]|uniref:Glycine--tRNA ligase beta subunit n=1 Tax=Candidatus Pantoea carbekii TaxID=1235990 RepID=U3U583_9GAMM|nr:glycyl-tRNA synthetase subunit beta [Candidatus Pantoea carbekii]